jgi:hypothetical protein
MGLLTVYLLAGDSGQRSSFRAIVVQSDPKSLDHPVQRSSLDSEDHSCSCLVALASFEDSLDGAVVIPVGVGEGGPPVAEELALEERLGNGPQFMATNGPSGSAPKR